MKRTTTITTFLDAVSGAAELADVNIAAGVALQELRGLERGRLGREIRRGLVLVAACLVALTLSADVFASSPVHVGIVPYHPHVFTHLGLRDWSQNGPSVFGHRLPWAASGVVVAR